MAAPQHKLMFGSQNLIGTDAELALLGYKFQTVAEGTTWGNAVPIEEKIISLLQDGAIVGQTGYDNREDMFVQVRITGADSEKLAQGAQALMLETGRPNLLIWTPPDDGPACVFSVVMSNLLNNMDDLGDVRNQYTYRIRIQAEPFVRSEDLVEVFSAAPTGLPTITSIPITSSATGWSSEVYYAGSPTTGGVVGSPPPIVVQASPLGMGSTSLSAIKTGISQSLSGTPYLRIEVDVILSGASLTVGGETSFAVNGVGVPVVAQVGDYYWLDTTAYGIGTLTDLRVSISGYAPSPGGSMIIRVVSVARSDQVSFGATNRQLTRTLQVTGSARTQGNLMIEAADPSGDVALGDTFVYTTPEVPGLVTPDMRQFLTSGNTPSVASSSISGTLTELGTLHTFDIPVGGLTPGGYLLMAYIKPDNPGPVDLTWTALARMNSVNLPDGQAGVTTPDLDGGAWNIVNVAELNLPPRKMGPDGVVRIELQAATMGNALDEAWLFNMETGRLTIVRVGSASPSPGGSGRFLFLDAPSVQSPVPAAFIGFESDRTDAFHVADEALSFMVHEFLPGPMRIFTATSVSDQADITLSHFPRFNTHVVASA